MKIEIQQKQLSELLVTAYKAIDRKPTLSILTNFLFQADVETQKVFLTGFNGNLGIRTKGSCKVHNSGIIALNAELLTDVINSLSGNLTLEMVTNQVIVTHATGKCRLTTTDPTEFPELPLVEGVSITLKAETLREAFSTTLLFAAKDELKQVLAGIHLKLSLSNSLTNWEAAATDGHRLGICNASNGDQEFDNAVTIPYKTASCLNEILDNAKENCQITTSDSSICFELPNTQVSSRLLQDDYPAYKSLIPTQFSYEFAINKKSLKEALNRVAAIACSKDKIVQITFTKDRAVLYAESPDLGGAVESVAISALEEYTDFSIGFNIKYLAEAIKVITTSELTIKAEKPSYPVIITPIGEKISRQIVLIMPVQLKEIKKFDVLPETVQPIAA